jgi:hypothetical protein
LIHKILFSKLKNRENTQASFIKHHETASKRGLKLKSTFHTNTSDKGVQKSNFVLAFFDIKFKLEHTKDIGLRKSDIFDGGYLL